MRRPLIIALALAGALGNAHAQAPAESAAGRLVVRTIAGDLLFTMDDSDAARRFRTLVRARATGTAFTRFDPGAFVEWPLAASASASAPDASTALPTPAIATPLQRGALVFAPRGSVLLLLGPSTGQGLALIAHLETGEAVLDQLASVPRDRHARPRRALTVLGVEWFAPATPLADLHLAPARRVHRASAASVLGASVRHGRRTRPRDQPIFIGVALMVLLGALKIALRRRLPRRHSVSIDLVMMTIGFVLLLMMRLPLGSPAGWIGTLLFVGLAVLYRMLGHFEEPAEKEHS